jgi:hypothetical protein
MKEELERSLTEDIEPEHDEHGIVKPDTDPMVLIGLMNPVERRFCQYFLTQPNQQESMAMARYGKPIKELEEREQRICAQYATFVLNKGPHARYVRCYIAHLNHELFWKEQVDAQAIINKLKKIALMDRTSIIEAVGQSLDFSKLSRDQKSIIDGAEFEVYMDGRGDDARPVKKVKLRFSPMRDACNDLMKHYNQYAEHEREAGKGAAETLLDIAAKVMARRAGVAAGPEGPMLDGSSDDGN